VAPENKRRACISVGFSGCEKNGHIPAGPIWLLEWLPKGYGPTYEDRLLAVFFDTDGKWDRDGLRMPEECDEEKPRPLPGLLQVVVKAIEDHLREHPEDAAGHISSKDWGGPGKSV
jgi:hypothetical protein